MGKKNNKPRAIKLYDNLPLEVGKTYKTKFSSGDVYFTVERDPYLRDEEGVIYDRSHTVWGTYSDKPHLGICPLGIDRIIHDKVENGMKHVCPHCKEDLEL